VSGFVPNAPRVWPSLAVLDAAALAVAGLAAYVLRFQPATRAFKLGELAHYPGLLVVALLAMWALAAGIELYEPFLLRRRREVALRVWAVAGMWGASLALTTYLVPAWRFGRGLLLLTTLGWGLLATVSRSLLARWLAQRPRPTALVMGEPEAVQSVCEKLRSHPFAPWEPADGSGIAAEHAAEETRRRGVELVILAGAEASAGRLAGDLATLHFTGVPVVIASEAWALLDGRLPLDELSPSSFLHQPGFGAVHWELFNRFTRVADVILGSLASVVAAPILAVAALAVLLTDGRPVFFLQWRVGQFGRGFRVIKLRTMRRDAEEHGPSFATPGDPRVTRLGRLLRRLRIDELPQLVNVLRGDMSLVGPRPERPEFVTRLMQEIPYYTFRLAVPPGLTGWAQVNMPYARKVEDHRRKLEYDLYFIRERSVALYVLTLLRTFAVAVLGARR
jgi:exopolysaccharide biosynthesis polyprenyl glycosylphosphotransferase